MKRIHTERMNKQLPVILTSLILVITGCQSLGPSKISPERMDYSDAIRNSEAEQLLKNLVRLRFGTSPELLDLTQVVSQYELESTGGIGASFVEGGNTTYPLSAGFSFQESPTITYSPVTGREFALRMLSPIQPWQVYLLSRSGWDLNRLLCATIQQMNNLQNLQTSFGMSRIPTPESLGGFVEAAALLEELVIQDQVRITVGTARENGLSGSSKQQKEQSKSSEQTLIEGVSGFDGVRYYLLFTHENPPEKWKTKVNRLKTLLQLRLDMKLFPILSSDIAYTGARDEVLILANRSILNLMLYLTAGIEVPNDLQGLAPVAYEVVDQVGGISTDDYMVYPSSVFNVYSGLEKPDDAFVAVQHQNFWFWINNHDRNTKITFSLLEYLIRLQDAKSSDNSPGVLLTIPTR